MKQPLRCLNEQDSNPNAYENTIVSLQSVYRRLFQGLRHVPGTRFADTKAGSISFKRKNSSPSLRSVKKFARNRGRPVSESNKGEHFIHLCKWSDIVDIYNQFETLYILLTKTIFYYSRVPSNLHDLDNSRIASANIHILPCDGIKDKTSDTFDKVYQNEGLPICTSEVNCSNGINLNILKFSMN